MAVQCVEVGQVVEWSPCRHASDRQKWAELSASFANARLGWPWHCDAVEWTLA